MQGRLAHDALATLVIALVASTSVRGQIIVAGPFTGDWSETFESQPPGFHASLPILMDSDEQVGANGFMQAAFITSGSSFMGSTIEAHSGLLFAHSTGPVDFVFPNPIAQFGGYVATNSGASGGTVQFFDEQDNLISTQPLAVSFQPGLAPYAWNGWSSSIPFSRVHIESNGTLNGFLGFDDLQASLVPGPGAVSMLVLLASGRPRRRRRA